MRTRIKICGITRAPDALAAAAAGADAIGLVFYPGSPRAMTPEAARLVVLALPPFVTAVGVFVNAPAAEVNDVLAAAPLGLLQFHGDETEEYCRQFGRPYLKAVRVRPAFDLLQYAAGHPAAAALLLDAYRIGVPGGTGETFDWQCIPERMPCRVVLSGGLNPANVADGAARVRPWAVDVSSGVESAPGVKDPGLIGRFVTAVKQADNQMNGAEPG